MSENKSRTIFESQNNNLKRIINLMFLSQGFNEEIINNYIVDISQKISDIETKYNKYSDRVRELKKLYKADSNDKIKNEIYWFLLQLIYKSENSKKIRVAKKIRSKHIDI